VTGQEVVKLKAKTRSTVSSSENVRIAFDDPPAIQGESPTYGHHGFQRLRGFEEVESFKFVHDVQMDRFPKGKVFRQCFQEGSGGTFVRLLPLQRGIQHPDHSLRIESLVPRDVGDRLVAVRPARQAVRAEESATFFRSAE
jgi:hypothetical protein